MAGIYVHIPYCRQACSYCDFYFSTNQNSSLQVVDCIGKEIHFRKDELPDGEEIETLYFGGGTPSILTINEMSQIMKALKESFDFSSLKEFTLEANPDDISPDWISEMKKFGVNRLSVGIQTFNDNYLRLLNRVHNSELAISSLRLSMEGGFRSNTFDLIYGIPGQSIEELNHDIEILLKEKVKHISAYALTVEKGTLLAHQLKNEKVKMPDDEKVFEHFSHVVKRLTDAGFEHYELSNFAQPDYHALHNSSYWSGAPYLGFGPSAHSFVSGQRSWNVANNLEYVRMVTADGSALDSKEVLTASERFNEWMMTSLRISKGIRLDELQDRFAWEWTKEDRTKIDSWKRSGHMKEEDGRISLTLSGKFISDSIISDFFRN